jgi:hypothetical protein
MLTTIYYAESMDLVESDYESIRKIAAKLDGSYLNKRKHLPGGFIFTSRENAEKFEKLVENLRSGKRDAIESKYK